MALYLEELKQIFREEEQNAGTIAEELQIIKLEAIKARQELERERHELNKAKAQAQQEQARQRIELAREKEQRARERQKAQEERAERQKRTEAATFWGSVGVTLFSVLTSFILFIIILLKY